MRKSVSMFMAVLFVASSAMSGEGMWMPQQVPQLAPELRKLGLEIDPKQLADLTGFPMGAVISLGGCTASFVSPEGLVVTNHHCAYGAIQYNTTPQNDYLTNGFLAKTMAEEVPAGPGSRVFVTTAIEDVTKEMIGTFPKNTNDLQRYKLIDQRRKKIVEECEKQGGVRCSVSTFFEGSQYLKITQMEIRDVRLVYAPAMGVGNYGGEEDNWMWPRHTGDFAFYRAYVGKDGKPADFSKENVPYRPKHFLRVSTEGVDEGDLVLVAGYPGRTYRYQTADEVRNSQEFTLPTTIRYAKDLNAILEAESKKSKEIEIANTSRIKGNANVLKNYEGTLDVFKSGTVLSHRQQRESELAAFLAKNPEMNKKYGSAVAEIARLNAQARATRERDTVLGWILRSSPMLSQAVTLYRLSIERPKADIEREGGFQERDWNRIKEGVDRAQKQIEPGSDRAGLRYFLKEAIKLPADQRLTFVDAALKATGEANTDAQIEKFLDQLYANTKIGDLATRQAMINETTAQLKARNDAMMNFAASIVQLGIERENRDRSIAGAMSRIRPLYLEALREMNQGKPMFPDANGTLRVTFGTVQGYRPKDAVWYAPQTTLSGVVKKHRGEGEFDAPDALLAAAKNPAAVKPYLDPQINDVPVNFLSNVDTTGGNSGSPTLNAKGELAGLLFDGNLEGLGGDYLVNPEVGRSIHVDAVYMIWVMDAVDKAHNLLREMNLPVRSGM